MKSYTDIEQSKKLAEFLPNESADMWWAERYAGKVMPNGQYIVDEKPVYYLSLTKPSDNDYSQDTVKDIPCWSLVALLNSVKYNTVNLHYNDVRNDWIASCTMEHSTRYESGRALNPVDACYEMILKLHELNIL